MKWLSRLPVTEEIAGSNPVGPAKHKHYKVSQLRGICYTQSVDNIQTLFQEFRAMPFPSSAYSDKMELAEWDGTIAGMVSSHLAGTDFNKNEVQRCVDEVRQSLPELDNDARAYSLKLIELGEALLASK